MRILIKLNLNEYAIDVDDKCYTAIRFGKNGKTGEPAEYQMGFYSKLSNAALRLCREEVASSSSIVSLKEFVAICEANNNQLLKQLEAVPV